MSFEFVEDVIVVCIDETEIVIEVADAVALTKWGMIRGDIADQEDLQTVLAGKSDKEHNHDDRYYTEEETNALLLEKEDVLTFDSAPVNKSNNPVTSGGIYAALGGKATYFTNISALGFSSPTTVINLVTAMPGNSIFSGRLDTALASSEYPPLPGMNLLWVVKYNISRWFCKIHGVKMGDNGSYYELATSGSSSGGVITGRLPWKVIFPSILFFTGLACGTGGTICRIPENGTDFRISEDTVVLQMTFSDPSAVSGVSWVSSEGYITFTGTCTDGTCTMDVILGQKGN